MTNQNQRRYLFLNSAVLLASLFSEIVFGATSESEILYLTLQVNGIPLNDVFEVEQRNGRMSILRTDAPKLKFRTDDLPIEGEWMVLQSAAGLSYVYDDLNQQLMITAESSRLTEKQRLNINRNDRILRETQFSPAVSGTALSYNIFANHTHVNNYVAAYTDIRTFGTGNGTFSSSFNSKYYDKKYANANSGTTRLMSNWNWENVDKLLSFTVGDSYTTNNSWSRSVRFGGISLAKQYSLQPGINTFAQDILTDSVTLPSTVDLYIRGIKTASQQVMPGQFTLNTAPVLTGNNGAQVVITDMNGQQRVVNLALYGTNKILTQGLSLWGLNAGWIRKDYGLRSFRYQKDIAGVADWRYGAANHLTFSLHTEQSAGLNHFGTGIDWLLSPALGILHSDIAWGRHQDESGMQWGTGWQWNNRYLNIGVNHVQRERTFHDITALSNGLLPERQSNAFVSLNVQRIGTLGTSWISQQHAQHKTRYGGLSWSKSFSGRDTLAATFTQSLEKDKNKTFFLSYTRPLSHRHYLSARHSSGTRNTANQLSFNQTLESNVSGWGWRASARSGEVNSQHVSVERRNTWSDMALGMNRYSGQRDYHASMSGTVGMFMGSLYATRDLGDSFILVDTNGKADIPVLLEHRAVGKTDKQGRLFLSNAVANHPNSVDIDILDLPEDFRAPYANLKVIPRWRNGAFARFDVYQTRSMLLTVKTADGEWVPFAAKIQVRNAKGERLKNGNAGTVVGYEGAIYLEDPPVSGYIDVSWEHKKCSFTLPERKASEKSILKRNVTCH